MATDKQINQDEQHSAFEFTNSYERSVAVGSLEEKGLSLTPAQIEIEMRRPTSFYRLVIVATAMKLLLSLKRNSVDDLGENFEKIIANIRKIKSQRGSDAIDAPAEVRNQIEAELTAFELDYDNLRRAEIVNEDAQEQMIKQLDKLLMQQKLEYGKLIKQDMEDITLLLKQQGLELNGNFANELAYYFINGRTTVDGLIAQLNLPAKEAALLTALVETLKNNDIPQEKITEIVNRVNQERLLKPKAQELEQREKTITEQARDIILPVYEKLKEYAGHQQNFSDKLERMNERLEYIDKKYFISEKAEQAVISSAPTIQPNQTPTPQS